MFSILILIILMSTFESCEVDLSSSIGPVDSKIWVNAIVGVNDTVKIYLGNTSGLNSGDKTQYRKDAVVKLKVNSGTFQSLKYRVDPRSPYKGYYKTNRLENSFEGDTIKFIAWIPRSEFDTVKGETYIPRIPSLEDPIVKSTSVNSDLLVDINLSLADSSNYDKYYEIKMQSLNYSNIYDELPSEIDDITLLNDLKMSYGLTWNEKLNSILIDYNDLEDDNLNISYKIKNNHSKINLGLQIKKVTKEYYEYFKALDGGTIVKSNIENGSGIFAGYACYRKEFVIK